MQVSAHDPERYAFQASHEGSIPVSRTNPTQSLTCVIDYCPSLHVAILVAIFVGTPSAIRA